MSTLLQELATQQKYVERLYTQDAGRIPLMADLTLYVRTDGSDLNHGLVNDASGAFATIQAAVDVAASLYDPRLFNLVIQIQAGTWSLASTLVLKRHIGHAPIVLRGDTTTPANCILQSDASYVVHNIAEYAPWKLEGLTLQRQTGTTNNFGFVSERGNTVFGRMALGAHGTGAQVLLSSASFLTLDNQTIDVLGAAQAVLRAADHSIIRANGVTFVFPGGGVAFSGSTVMAQSHGSVYIQGCTFTNGALVTGTRYTSDMLAHIRTNGGGAAYIPGNAAGAATNGGIYT